MGYDRKTGLLNLSVPETKQTTGRDVRKRAASAAYPRHSFPPREGACRLVGGVVVWQANGRQLCGGNLIVLHQNTV